MAKPDVIEVSVADWDAYKMMYDALSEALFAMLRCGGGGYEDKARAIRELTEIGYFEDEEYWK